jgi:hypothetical protein
MKQLLWALPCAMTVMFLVSAAEYAHARGRGGFSREGPAASGGFASRSESMRGHEGGFQSSRQQSAAGAQASRQQYGAHAQASRQQEANSLQSSREQTAQGMQSRAQQYRGAYPYAASAYPAWDAGAGAAAMTGAAIGAAAASLMHPAAAAYAATAPGQPCANPMAVPAGDMNYLKCGSAWYTQAFGPSGPMFVQVAPPPGF